MNNEIEKLEFDQIKFYSIKKGPLSNGYWGNRKC